MSSQAVPSQPRVLIVDNSAETRAVLRDLLERDGAAVTEACSLADATTVAQQGPLGVVVVDADETAAKDDAAAEDMRAWATQTDTPVVVVGTNRATAAFPAASVFVRKPYHYPALLHKIHGVLARRRAA